MLIYKIGNDMKLTDCTRCGLSKSRTNVVKGTGNTNCVMMLIGEAPGFDEDRIGRPFVGKAGKILDRYLNKAKIKRVDIYITNVVKCRPPKNRDPFDYEKGECECWLKLELKKINPLVIVTLGRHAFNSMKLLYKDKLVQITSMDEIDYMYGIFDDNKLKKVLIKVIHPAATIYNPKLIPLFQEQIIFSAHCDGYLKTRIMKKKIIGKEL
jgi:DNA polymerase